jgi:hypothetical protein
MKLVFWLLCLAFLATAIFTLAFQKSDVLLADLGIDASFNFLGRISLISLSIFLILLGCRSIIKFLSVDYQMAIAFSRTASFILFGFLGVSVLLIFLGAIIKVP